MFQKKSTKDLVHPDSTDAAGASGGPKPKKEKRHVGKLSLKEIVRSRPFLGGVCVVAALLLAFVVTPLLQLKIAETTTVVVLTQSVPVGTQLTADLLGTKEMGVLNLPLGALTGTAEAIGKYAAVAGVEGDILTAARLADTLPGDDPALNHLPEGKLAVSATLRDLAQSVSGKLRAGDVIRLYAILDPSASVETPDLSAVPVPELQYVEVLAVTSASTRDVRSEHERMGQEVADSDRQISTVTVMVNNRQAAVLAGLEHNAALHAALVVRGDAEKKQAALDAQEAYFAEPVEVPAVPGAVGETVPAEPGAVTPPDAATPEGTVDQPNTAGTEVGDAP